MRWLLPRYRRNTSILSQFLSADEKQRRKSRTILVQAGTMIRGTVFLSHGGASDRISVRLLFVRMVQFIRYLLSYILIATAQEPRLTVFSL